jgi:hypothetical protein
MDRFPCLRSFHAVRNFSCVNLKFATADILPHSGHKYYILDVHLPGLIQAKRRFPFAKRGQCRNHPMTD